MGEIIDYNAINGWYSMSDEKLLREVCNLLPDKSLIVEFGFFMGKSAMIMASETWNRNCHIVSFDDLSHSDFNNVLNLTVKDNPMRLVRHYGLENKITLHILDYYNYYVLRERVKKELDKYQFKGIGLLHIDGEHSMADVAYCFCALIDFILPEGFIVLHDTEEFPAPKQFVKWVEDANCEFKVFARTEQIMGVTAFRKDGYG